MRDIAPWLVIGTTVYRRVVKYGGRTRSDKRKTKENAFNVVLLAPLEI